MDCDYMGTPLLDQVEAEHKPAPELVPLNIKHIQMQAPPAREFLLIDGNGRGVMPAGVGCGIAGGGGVGKSTVVTDLAVALSSNIRWMGEYLPCDPCPVFYFTKEDEADEIHRRLWAITNRTPSILNANLLHIYPILGVDFHLTTKVGGMVIEGNAVDTVVDIVNRNGGHGLVILDPLRKMTAGEENGEAMSAAVQACDSIRQKTEGTCTTMIVHHSSKESLRGGDSSAAAFRGATDLVDGLRWTMIMSHLSDKERKNVSDAKSWRRMTVPKSNYTETDHAGTFVRWEDGRFMVEMAPEGIGGNKITDRHVQQLVSALKKQGPMTERKIRSLCSAEKGTVKISQRDLPDLIDKAIELKVLKPTQIKAENGHDYAGYGVVE